MFVPLMNNTFLVLLLLVSNFFTFSVCEAEENHWRLIGPGDADQVTSISIDNSSSVYVGTDIGGIYRSTDNGKSWHALNDGLLNHDITTPVIHDYEKSDIHYVGTRGGFYKSIDNGLTWRNVRVGLPEVKGASLSGSVGSIVQDSYNPSRLYLGMGYRPSTKGNATITKLKWLDHIFVSDDKGESWRKLPAFGKAQRVNQIVSSENKTTIYIAADEGLYKTSNSGMHWKKIYSKSILNLLSFKEKPNLLIASAGSDGVIKSEDKGETWRKINKGLSFGYLSNKSINRYSVLASSDLSPGLIYVTNSTWKGAGGLYASEDYGESWVLLTKSLPESWLKTSRRMNAVAVSPDNTLFLGSSRYLYSSGDKGAKWKQLISKRFDGGWTHTGINVFGHTRVARTAPDNENIIYIGTADHGILRSINGGLSWNPIGKSLKYADNVWDIDVCSKKPESLFIIGSNIKGNLCVSASRDKGVTWHSSCEALGRTNRNEKIHVDQQDCTTAYITGSKGLIRGDSTNGNWRSIFQLGGVTVNDVALGSNSGNHIYAATNKGIYRSKDGGTSWSALPALNNTNITSILVSSVNPDIIFAGSNIAYNKSAEIYRSQDSGKSWVIVKSGLKKYISSFTQIKGKPETLYASTNDYNYHDRSMGTGVYKSIDHGVSWQPDNHGLPTLKVFDVSSSSASDNKVYLSLQGSGVYVKRIK